MAISEHGFLPTITKTSNFTESQGGKHMYVNLREDGSMGFDIMDGDYASIDLTPEQATKFRDWLNSDHEFKHPGGIG